MNVLHSDPVNIVGERSLRVHHGLLDVFDEASMHFASLGRLILSLREL